MPVLQSVQLRKLTSILINHKNCQLFRTLLALSFIHFFRRPVFVWQKSCLLNYRFVSVVFVSVVVNVQFSFAVLPAIFVSYISSSPFFLGNLHSKRRGKFFSVYFYCHLAIFRWQILSSAG